MEPRPGSLSEPDTDCQVHREDADTAPDCAPGRGRRTVGLFIDFENLTRSLQARHHEELDAGALGARLYDLAGSRGRVLISRAYGDWTAHGGAARDLRRNRVEPILVLPKESGDSRAGMELALDVHTTLFEGPPLGLYVLVSGDTDLHPLLLRLREAGCEVVLASTREAAGRELVQGAESVAWLDDLLDLQSGREEEPLDVESYNWGPFVRLLDVLEGNLEFIGLNYLIRRVLDRGNCGYSDMRRKQEVVNAAQGMGIIDVYQVENKEQAGDPVSACRLVRDFPVVERHLTPETDG